MHSNSNSNSNGRGNGSARERIVDEYDVVVVGAGNAALVAALAAHDEGARVLVLEAAPEAERGGNSRFSGGIFRCAHDGLESLLPLVTEESARWADRVAVDAYPAAQYAEDYGSVSQGRNRPDLTGRVIDGSYETVQWMAQHGVRWELSIGKLIDPEQLAAGDQLEVEMCPPPRRARPSRCRPAVPCAPRARASGSCTISSAPSRPRASTSGTSRPSPSCSCTAPRAAAS